MVSEQSARDSDSNILHHFIISNSMANNQAAPQFGDNHFDPYGGGAPAAVTNNGNPFPHSLPSTIIAPPRLPEESGNIVQGTRLMDLLGTSRESSGPARMLSLSLGSVSGRQRSLNPVLINHQQITRGSGDDNNHGGFDSFTGGGGFSNQCCSTSYGAESFSAVIGNSKYLKPAQALLEEMVSVGGREMDESNKKLVERLFSPAGKGLHGISTELKAELSNGEMINEQGTMYLNLIKLLSLLEEVERRYEEYHRQLNGVVSSFEMIAGLGAGKSYTALALQAMSKHFSSLKKSIVIQIRAAKHKIEKDMPKIGARLSQLSLFVVEQEPPRNRVSLQQLGLLQNPRQAFRPIRGLPENSVAILRAWLFEHFLHPYPNDSEKLILASQTGLSKNQVSNWFINARVRLWKPMIEEMYKDEFGEFSTES
ncbi:hypothetical protein M569_12981, partial [Genlisea aurea]